MVRAVIELSRAEARRLLIAHHRLARPVGRGASGVRKLLERLRCIQLDPLDLIGTNWRQLEHCRSRIVAEL